jgi:ribosomal protein S18 acetylase RimI-like enzyme
VRATARRGVPRGRRVPLLRSRQPAARATTPRLLRRDPGYERDPRGHARRAPGGEIVGVAEWHAPEPPPGTRVRALRHLPRLVRAIGVRHLRAVSRTEAKFRRFTPREPHWYLAHLAVGPQAQGMGVGGRLLTHRLTLIDAAPVPVYLEATSAGNRRLYERHDFRPVGTIELTPQVHSTAMLRPARPSDGGD